MSFPSLSSVLSLTVETSLCFLPQIDLVLVRESLNSRHHSPLYFMSQFTSLLRDCWIKTLIGIVFLKLPYKKPDVTTLLYFEVLDYNSLRYNILWRTFREKGTGVLKNGICDGRFGWPISPRVRTLVTRPGSPWLILSFLSFFYDQGLIEKGLSRTIGIMNFVFHLTIYIGTSPFRTDVPGYPCGHVVGVPDDENHSESNLGVSLLFIASSPFSWTHERVLSDIVTERGPWIVIEEPYST